jgi:hypothetical protein
MTFSFSTPYRAACGLLLLTLASCSPTVPPPESSTNTPDTAATDRPSAIPEPGESTSSIAPPGQTDRDQSSKPDPIAAAPNSAATADSIRILSCKTSGGLVNDPNGPLNVRSAPDTGSDNVVGSIADGAPVSIVGDRGNWWQIDAPETGWVSKNLIDSTCNEKIARIEFSPNTASVTLSDRFLGTGYHHYLLEARAGQELTIEALDDASPLPFVIAPDDRDITDGVGNTNATQWSGTLPEDGDYTLVFDSNFRGYTYEVMLNVK